MDGVDGREMRWLALEAFDSAPIAVALTVGQEHRLVYTNLVYRAHVGDRPLGQPIADAFDDETQRAYGGLFDHVLATGEPVSLVGAPVNLASTRDEDLFFSFSLSRFAGARPGVLVIAAEVTEQVAATRRADQALIDQERIRRRFESLVWLNAQIVWVADPTGLVTESSGTWEQVTGQRWEDYRGEGWSRVLHPDDRQAALRSWNNALRQETSWHYTYRVRTREGEYRHFDLHAAPVFENGVVVE